eukprot:SAG31_NODE_405_length_16084_cov_3.913982_3_plen_86_part_00
MDRGVGNAQECFEMYVHLGELLEVRAEQVVPALAVVPGENRQEMEPFTRIELEWRSLKDDTSSISAVNLSIKVPYFSNSCTKTRK